MEKNYPIKYVAMPRIVEKNEDGKKIEEIDLWVPVTCLVIDEKIENDEILYEVIFLRNKNNLSRIFVDFENNSYSTEFVNCVSDSYEDISLLCEEMNSFIFAKRSKDKNNGGFLVEIQNKLFEKCYESLDKEKVKKIEV